MAEYLIKDTTLQDIANSIRSKTGKSGNITPENMPSEITAIETGTTGIIPSGTKPISSNGTYDVTSYASAKVEVPTLKLQDVTVNNVTANLALGGSSLDLDISADGETRSMTIGLNDGDDPITANVIKDGVTILGVKGEMPVADLGFNLCFVDLSWLNSFGDVCTHEFSGFILPCSYGDWLTHKTEGTLENFVASNSLVSFDTFSDYVLARDCWQTEYGGFITAQNRPFIIWSESNVEPTANSGNLYVTGHMGCGVVDDWLTMNPLPELSTDTCHRFDINTQKIYYGYICEVTGESAILGT